MWGGGWDMMCEWSGDFACHVWCFDFWDPWVVRWGFDGEDGGLEIGCR